MRRFMLLVLAALLAAAPAMVLRITGWRPDPVADALFFGVAVLAAGFMLSWGAEAAEKHISQGLIVALVALVTVLPEYAVDLYYAFRAGQAPQSNYVHYAAANMTGANRLLVGLAWPLMVLLHWLKTRNKALELSPVNAVEIAFLMLGSLYAFVILFKGAIAPFDFAVLFLIFAGYLYRVSQLPKADDDDDDEDEEPGPAAALNALRPTAQWAWMGGLTLIAFVVIATSAEPFAEAMVGSGRILGVDEFLLIQWLAPLASEAPAVTIAVLFVLAGRAVSGLTAMISDKINQWTLLVGMLPLAMSLGAGGLIGLPLDARQKEEFLLTAAQSLFAIMLLVRLRISVLSAGLLFALFAVQVGLAFHFREDEVATVNSLTILAWTYLGLAAILVPLNGRRVVAVLRDGLLRSHRRMATAPEPHDLEGE
ncbi:sodium:proton exchanger [Caulobacter flavus]|jgi:cation:H+ antiporter|uniref:Sodium:proton exchanger n=3 Tax=Caulobacteraceae TaxID=76892 RepID=A0A2N5CPU8_9CAUL|nr:sodium:proton exchanger [Caulobacter sp. FWC26]AZS19389.1 sodium:proton exchanger [Caulobacter sp. FWC26]NQE65443.1 Sodium/calcium exchanger family protein [Caulobacter sp. RHG1]PLR09173.1 sodium:proton exchanger [Caulobacter flavus]